MKEKISAALGFFDGVHMAHKQVLSQAANVCPRSIAVIINRPGGKKLITQALKYEAIRSLGISDIAEFSFEEIRYLSCKDFIQKILAGKLNVTTAVCGYNFHFGHSGIGDSSTLEMLGSSSGIETIVTPPVIFDSTFVSSTRVRELLSEGNTSLANTLLTRPFGYDFKVINGVQLAGKHGFPTINQEFPDEFFIPEFGVYASETVINKKVCPSITNIGIRPTFEASKPLSETHVFDYSGDLYGQNVHVMLKKFIRAERKFSGVEELKKQVEKDMKNARI